MEEAWFLDSIHAPRRIHTPFAERGLVIAVIDDGVRISHRDLQGFIWRNEKEIPANGIDDDGNGYLDDVHGWDVSDEDNSVAPPDNRPEEFYHGTHLAGVITQIVTRAYGASAADLIQILPVKTLANRANQTYLKDGFKGIAYAIEAGADIIVTAWGVEHISADESRILQQARDKGILIVASAGNFPTGREQYPAAGPSVLAVAALNQEDSKTEISNYGVFVDLAAPGTDILSTSATSDTDFETREGTSQAAAIVAAAAAIVKLQHPSYSWPQVTACLKQSADLIDVANPKFTALLGAGKLNLQAAIDCRVFAEEATQPSPLLHPQGYLHFDSRHGTSAAWNITPHGDFKGLRFRRPITNGEATGGTIEFYAGQSADAGLITSYPLAEMPETVFVAGTSAGVVFKGEDIDQPMSWFLEYEAEPIDFSRLYCKDTKDLGVEGVFDDGSGPKDYSYHSNCKWLITAPQGKVIHIRFSEFDTQAKIDKLYFFNGAGTHESIMAIFSGSDIPPELTTWGEQVLVWFVTDGEVQGKGWRGEFRFVDPG